MTWVNQGLFRKHRFGTWAWKTLVHIVLDAICGCYWSNALSRRGTSACDVATALRRLSISSQSRSVGVWRRDMPAPQALVGLLVRLQLRTFNDDHLHATLRATGSNDGRLFHGAPRKSDEACLVSLSLSRTEVDVTTPIFGKNNAHSTQPVP
jgi:hypothetical protein